ncbi:hypothetical protein D3C73_1037470 [compost metagenome]
MLLLIAVMNQISDADQLEVMLLRNLNEIRQAGHRAVSLDHFADYARRIGAAHASQIDCGFGVAGAAQHAAFFGDQREHMARSAEVRRLRVRVHQRLDRKGTLTGGNAGSRIDMVNGHGKSGAVIVGIVSDHRLQIQLFRPFRCNRHTDQAAALGDHEIDYFRGGPFSQGDKIPFILAVLVIDDNNHFTAHQIINGIFDGV